MANIKLTHEILEDTILYDESDFEFEGESYEYVENAYKSIDENGRSFTYLYKRKSDGKYFMVTVYQARNGYEDYSYYSCYNDCELYEVKKVEKVITTWEVV